MKNKIITILLVLSMIFSITACKKDKDKDSDKNGLTVDVEKVEYGKKYISETKEDVKLLTTELAEAFDFTVSDDELTSVGEFFENELVAILTDIGIYPSEFTSLIGYVREYIALATDSESTGDDGPQAVSDMYSKFSSVLDAERLGALAYELHLFCIEGMLDEAKENYEEYKYPYLKEDIDYYEDLLVDAKGLGRKNYADALSVISFTASSFNGTADFDDNGIDISTSDTLELMRMQGEKFASLELDEGDWETVAEMYEALMPTTGSDDIVALNNDNFFVESADIMPHLLDFYAEMTSDISDTSVSLIESGSAYCYEAAMCRELIKNEDDFRDFLAKIERKIPGKSENTEVAAKLYNSAGYESFCENYNVTAEQLIAAVRECANNPSEYNCEELYDAFLGYIAHVNPAVAYLLIYV